MQFVAVLRRLFRFAERAAGGFAQQDAEELYNTVMGQLGMVLSPSALGTDGEAQKIFAGSSTSVIDALFGIEIEQTDTCLEAEAEAPSMRKVNEFKLRCNIQGGGGTKDEEKEDHLFQDSKRVSWGRSRNRHPRSGAMRSGSVCSALTGCRAFPASSTCASEEAAANQMDPSTGTNCR